MNEKYLSKIKRKEPSGRTNVIKLSPGAGRAALRFRARTAEVVKLSVEKDKDAQRQRVLVLLMPQRGR